jgi:hypothetical protein
MAAGLGFKTFNTGDVLSAADTNGYLMQGVLVFANATARDAAITSPQEGQFAFTKDNDSLWYYSGSAWVSSGATGDIEGVTAGTGISGGGTSGTVTVTNSMATAIDAKGDLIAGTGADTFARLAVGGTNGHTLQVDSSTATGLAWAAPASSGGFTSLASGSLSGLGQTLTISSIPNTYKNLQFVVKNYQCGTDTEWRLRYNNISSSDYIQLTVTNDNGTALTNGYVSGTAHAPSYWDKYRNSNAVLVVNLYDYANTSTWKIYDNHTTFLNNSQQHSNAFVSGSLRTTNAIDEIKFYVASGKTFTAGTYELFGVK